MAVIATVTVESVSGYAQKIAAGHHALTSDEPASRGGTDTGPNPYGLLLAALGACTSITLRMYAERKGWELGSVQVALRHLKSAEGGDEIERDLTFGAALTDEQRGRLAEIADKTPVTKTLAAGISIRTRLL
jgi:putative redox protein